MSLSSLHNSRLVINLTVATAQLILSVSIKNEKLSQALSPEDASLERDIYVVRLFLHSDLKLGHRLTFFPLTSCQLGSLRV